MTQVRAAKKRGYATTTNVFLPAMSSMAALVHGPGGEVLGTLIVAGPMTRLTEARMESLAPALLNAAQELGRSSSVSAVFQRRPDQPKPQV
jgi:DNA-binding IclR family transcriptional regulator